MSEVTHLECPCCGDVGATSDANGLYYDGQPGECGCLVWVSCDSENAPDLSIDDTEPCPVCDVEPVAAEGEGL